MDMVKASLILNRLEHGERKVMYTSPKGVQVTATQTGNLSRDFAVGLVIPGRPEFYPTHVRLLFDYYLKRLSEPRQVQRLFEAVGKVYAENDPEEMAQDVGDLTFTMQLDEAMVNLIYTQLLMIEQDLNYGPGGTKKSKYDPPRGFLMSFIRWVASGEDEIDKIITNAVRNWPPPVRFKDSPTE
ncbi:MAG: hypothetical protein A2144_02605 [Chloroflexi bacterium RBG_16_50_9]|nr:MAG: hypothetical protein A2144_02605 [Chloroflexi bacterium RBG_16_50_9]